MNLFVVSTESRSDTSFSVFLEQQHKHTALVCVCVCSAAAAACSLFVRSRSLVRIECWLEGWLAGCLVVEPNFSICRNVILFLFLSVHLPLSLFCNDAESADTRSLARSFTLLTHWERTRQRRKHKRVNPLVGTPVVSVCVCVCHWSTSVSIGRSVGRLVCWCRSIGIWAPVLATSFIIFSFFSVLLVLLLLIQ